MLDLKREIDTMGMNREQIKLFDLQNFGAAKTELEQIQKLMAMRAEKGLIAGIDELEKALKRQIATAGMSVDQMAIWELKQRGASDAQVARLQTLQKEAAKRGADSTASSAASSVAQAGIGAAAQFAPVLGEVQSGVTGVMGLSDTLRQQRETMQKANKFQSAGARGAMGAAAGLAGGAIGSSAGSSGALSVGRTLGANRVVQENALDFAGSVGGGAAGGAAAGFAVGGPVGAAVGAVTGAVTGVFSAISGGAERSKQAAEAARQAWDEMVTKMRASVSKTFADEALTRRSRAGEAPSLGELLPLLDDMTTRRLGDAPVRDRGGILEERLAEERRTAAKGAGMFGSPAARTASDARIAALEAATKYGVEGLNRGERREVGSGGAESVYDTMFSSLAGRSPLLDATEKTSEAVTKLVSMFGEILPEVAAAKSYLRPGTTES